MISSSQPKVIRQRSAHLFHAIQAGRLTIPKPYRLILANYWNQPQF